MALELVHVDPECIVAKHIRQAGRHSGFYYTIIPDNTCRMYESKVASLSHTAAFVLVRVTGDCKIANLGQVGETHRARATVAFSAKEIR